MAKKKTQAQLKKLLWKHFAKYIKERDKWTCVTCGRKATGQGMGAGHYIAKGACGLEYYFHEYNVHAQCTNCNCRLEGNRPAYRAFLVQKYGMDLLIDLETNYHKPYDGDGYIWLLDKIEHYKTVVQ